MVNTKEVEDYIVSFINNLDLRYEINRFPSGAIMIDIWKDRKFYVIQIERTRLGLSINEEDSMEFSSVADEYYSNLESFKIKFENLLK